MDLEAKYLEFLRKPQTCIFVLLILIPQLWYICRELPDIFRWLQLPLWNLGLKRNWIGSVPMLGVGMSAVKNRVEGLFCWFIVNVKPGAYDAGEVADSVLCSLFEQESKLVV